MYEDPDSLDCEAMILAADLYNYLVFFSLNMVSCSVCDF
jgi:hypothetical protein